MSQGLSHWGEEEVPDLVLEGRTGLAFLESPTFQISKSLRPIPTQGKAPRQLTPESKTGAAKEFSDNNLTSNHQKQSGEQRGLRIPNWMGKKKLLCILLSW